MLDLDKLRLRSKNGEQFDYLYFWGHQPSKTGEITKSCLSQWYAAPFTVDGIVYQTAEHWMMAAKARLFRDEVRVFVLLGASAVKNRRSHEIVPEPVVFFKLNFIHLNVVFIETRTTTIASK